LVVIDSAPHPKTQLPSGVSFISSYGGLRHVEQVLDLVKKEGQVKRSNLNLIKDSAGELEFSSGAAALLNYTYDPGWHSDSSEQNIFVFGKGQNRLYYE
jgi:hypothetical protein